VTHEYCTLFDSNYLVKALAMHRMLLRHSPDAHLTAFVFDDTAERIASEIEGSCDTLLVQALGPVVGAHAGPGTVGVGCYPAELFPLGLKRVSAAAAS